jgi:hypothetical protein
VVPSTIEWKFSGFKLNNNTTESTCWTASLRRISPPTIENIIQC